VGCSDGGTEGARGVDRRPILGGTIDTGDPAVGVLALIRNGQFYALCSGTLISPTIFLTAAHCVSGNDATISYRVYLVNDIFQAPADAFTAVSEVHANPRFSEANLPAGYDCAVALLSSPISGVSPKPYNRLPVTNDWMGQPARVVGFGESDADAGTGAGTKRMLNVTITGFTPTDLQIGRAGHTTCFGDSGGPLFSAVGGVETIIGVTSFGGASCDTIGQSARVDVCAAWIDGFTPDTEPPVVALTAPNDGDTLPAGFDVAFDATDNRGIASLSVLANDLVVGTLLAPPWTLSVPAGAVPAGATRLAGRAVDGNGNQAESATITVTVKAVGATPGDPGTPCASSADCTQGGFCATGDGSRFCSRSCDSSNPCPPGFDCAATPDFRHQCVAQHGDSGCSALPGRGRRTVLWVPLLALAVWLAGRGWRRRRGA
jgi:hypothetical protein